MKKKILLFVIATFVILITAILTFGPNYAKSYIEDNSVELAGRKIKMGELDFNAFNGHFLIADFRIYEEKDSSNFIQVDTFYTDLTLYKLFGGEFLTEALHIKGLDVNVWANKELFNFSDLIPVEDSSSVDTTIQNEDSFIKKFTINDIQILYSEVNYEDKDLNTFHDLKDINIRVPGITFGDERTTAGLEFALGKGGLFKLNVDYNLTERSYECDMSVEQLDLSPYLVYAQSSMNITKLEGWFSGDVRIIGDLDTPSNPVISGSMNLNDFSMTDNEGVEAFKMSSIFMNAKELNLASNHFHFGSLQVNKPVIKAILYKDFDNLSALIKSDVDTNRVVEIEVDSSLESAPVTYLLEEFRLKNGEVYYTDNAIANGPFEYNITDIEFSADSLTEGRNVRFDMDAVMNGKGTLNGLIITDPGNPNKGGTFDLDLKKIPIEDFSVFSLNSTAYPVNGGRLSFQTKNKVLNNHLNSHFIMQLYKTELGDKRKDLKPEYNVPMKLGVMVLEDPKKLIKIDMPAEGNLDDPEFKYSKLVWKVVMNVLLKAATSPYNLLAGAVGANEEDIKFIRFELIQWKLGPEQNSQLDLISSILEKKPGISVKTTQVLDVVKEQKLIKNYLAKKGFFLQRKHGSDTLKIELDEVDRAKVLHMDETDKLTAFLETKTGSIPAEHSFNELVDLYVQQSEVERVHQRILSARAINMRAYITLKGLSDRFVVLDEWVEDASRNLPRFEMEYVVKEE